jgi:uncharacterized membrane protein YcaP (DUF421 family)
MDAVVRVVFLYLFLLLVFRINGSRTLGQATTFDLLLLLILSETIQQALVGEDHSLTQAMLLIVTFLLMNVGLSLLKQRSKRFERLLEGSPVVLVHNGRPLREVMDRLRVDEDDVLEVVREQRGLERMEQVKFAILERNGRISIIPQEPA